MSSWSSSASTHMTWLRIWPLGRRTAIVPKFLPVAARSRMAGIEHEAHATPTPRCAQMHRDECIVGVVRTVAAYRHAPSPVDDPDAIRLASNESAFGPLPSVVAALAHATTAVHRYPDPACTDLRAVIGRRLDVAPELVHVGPGSAAVLTQLALATVAPGQRIVTPWPSFELYPILAQLAEAEHVPGAAAPAHRRPRRRRRSRRRQPPASSCWPTRTTPPARSCLGTPSSTCSTACRPTASSSSTRPTPTSRSTHPRPACRDSSWTDPTSSSRGRSPSCTGWRRCASATAWPVRR